MPAGNAESHWIVVLGIALIALAVITSVTILVTRLRRQRASRPDAERARR